MTPEEIEGNKVIAVFMDWHKSPTHGWLPPGKTDSWEHTNDHHLKYSSSFDWLMPACVKWKKMNPIPIFDRYIYYSDMLDSMIIMDYDVKMAFQQLVINIKWYNHAIRETAPVK